MITSANKYIMMIIANYNIAFCKGSEGWNGGVVGICLRVSLGFEVMGGVEVRSRMKTTNKKKLQ